MYGIGVRIWKVEGATLLSIDKTKRRSGNKYIILCRRSIVIPKNYVRTFPSEYRPNGFPMKLTPYGGFPLEYILMRFP